MKKIFFLSILIFGTFFSQSVVLASLTQAQCKSISGTCRNSFGGDGCYDSEKPVDSCTGGRGGGVTGPCCVSYAILCTNYNTPKGQVRSSANTCRTDEKLAFTWNTSTNTYACCVSNSTQPIPTPTPTPTPATNDAACKAQGGTCNTTCAAGSTQKGTCTSGQCCVPDITTVPPGGTTATPTLGAPVTISFPAPTQYTTVESFLDSVLSFARNIVVILALVFLVIGGLLYITSAGNDKRIGAAKAAITAALIGLAIVMVAPSFLKELAGVLGWGDKLSGEAATALTLTEIATNVLNFLLSIIGVLAIIMFLIGSIMYMSGGTTGDKDNKTATGKKIVKSAILGIIVTFSALVIVKQIASFF